ncbi:hypothetical protein SDC9_208839 [bioreactor metagenome]|uniref:Uncharacterized protein n=1 Tax=bioreactor metagenome TaxID=1076179 RepID=A0A645JBL2_9ZZZZ
MFVESVAVGTVGKRNIHHFRVLHGLLQSMADRMMIILCFNDRDGVVLVDIEDIVRPLGRPAHSIIAAQVDSAIRDLCFHGDLIMAPFGGDGRRDEPQLDIFFSHLLSINQGFRSFQRRLFQSGKGLCSRMGQTSRVR